MKKYFKKLISLIKKIFTGSIGIFKSYFNIGIASEQIIQRRSFICWNCEHRVLGKYSNKSECSECGCILEHKIRLKNEKCPLEDSRW